MGEEGEMEEEDLSQRLIHAVVVVVVAGEGKEEEMKAAEEEQVVVTVVETKQVPLIRALLRMRMTRQR